MKKILCFTVLLGCVHILTAQVGIGTSIPAADLEIIAKAVPDPGEFNGLIIPKVAVLPGTPAPSGLLIYLTAPSGTNLPGFYYSDGTNYIPVAQGNNGAFVETASPTTIATNRTANITRTGNVSIGGTLNSGKLNVEVVSANTSADPTGLFVSNVNTGTATSNTQSAVFENRATNNGMKFGILNSVNGNGGGSRTGIRNTVTNNGSGSNAENVIGIDNFIGAVDGAAATSINYGIRSEIGLTTSNANTIGIQSIARGTDVREDFSGWFQGDRFAIRNEDASTGYNLTVDTGTNGQVLTSNGAGGTSWANSSANKLRVRATFSNNRTFTNSNQGPNTNFIVWQRLIFDSEITTTNDYNEAAGVFTAPRDGYYGITINIRATFSFGSDLHAGLALRKNNDINGFYQMNVYRSDEFGNRVVRTLSSHVYLNAGDTIDMSFGYSETIPDFNAIEANTSELIIVEF